MLYTKFIKQIYYVNSLVKYFLLLNFLLIYITRTNARSAGLVLVCGLWPLNGALRFILSGTLWGVL